MKKTRLQTLMFFKSGRDNWKQKHKKKQAVIKYLKIKVRDLYNSRERWKSKAKELEQQLKKNKEN